MIVGIIGVLLLLVLTVIPAIASDDFVFVTTEGKELSLSDYLSQMAAPENLSDLQIMSVFCGVIVGVIGSTIVPHYLSGRKESFNWSYGWNAILSSVATGMLLMSEMPSNASVWYCFIIALLAQSGIKRLGDIGIDKSRKKGGST
jgi:hypothetical protein